MPSSASLPAPRERRRTPYLPTSHVGFDYSGSRAAPTIRLVGGPFTTRNNCGFTLSYPALQRVPARGTRRPRRRRTKTSRRRSCATPGSRRSSSSRSSSARCGSPKQRVAIQRPRSRPPRKICASSSQRYAFGASTLLDVLTSQSTLNQARAALIQARYDARVARGADRSAHRPRNFLNTRSATVSRVTSVIPCP